MEGETFGQYILKTNRTPRSPCSIRTTTTARTSHVGLKSALRGDTAKIVAEASYELSDPTIDSQIVTLKDSGADVLMDLSTPKFTAQAIRKVKELEWTPMQFLVSPQTR